MDGSGKQGRRENKRAESIGNGKFKRVKKVKDLMKQKDKGKKMDEKVRTMRMN